VVPDVLDTMIGAGEAADPKAAREAYEAGLKAEQDGDRLAAIEHYRKAVGFAENPDYLFRLAYNLDLLGEEDEALSMYELSVDSDQPHVNALLNLAVMYEDRGDVSRAERCLRQILSSDPNHNRANLYIMDVQASRDMFYDEEQVRDSAKRNALLDTPVTDFELSVRARNCLKKMQIRSLGDLLKITEAELLSYKNFGETSLQEIKAMLASKGLRLGQGIDGPMSRARREIYDELRGKAPDAVLNKPVSALDLSVRARKALQLLNIQTIGDLASRTEAELMGVKNFGATSLVEVNEKLTQFGLGLRKLD
jgi:DNA-directed RNA polymerase subunit alpha